MTDNLPLAGGVVALLLTGALTVLGFTVIVEDRWDWPQSHVVGFVGLLGVLASGALLGSAWKRWMAWLGLGLSIAFSGVVINPFFVGVVHLILPVALFVLGMAALNLRAGKKTTSD